MPCILYVVVNSTSRKCLEFFECTGFIKMKKYISKELQITNKLAVCQKNRHDLVLLRHPDTCLELNSNASYI